MLIQPLSLANKESNQQRMRQVVRLFALKRKGWGWRQRKIHVHTAACGGGGVCT